MSIQEALRLINNPTLSSLSDASNWADLGAGSGVFTTALAQLLPPQSTIQAVDQDARVLRRVPTFVQDVTITHHQADFQTISFDQPLDGILMANAIHYVDDKLSFIHRLKAFLKPKGILLIVEYDTSRSNPWVPYPITFHDLQSNAQSWGFQSFKKVGEKASIYNNGNIYAAIGQLNYR
jgi:ubiquinone/menaquinone biosynthesis C-methylase UbiE